MENNNFVDNKTLIFKEGSPANKLYIVKSGEVLCLKKSNDRLIPFFIAKDGDIIGENAMIEDSDYGYSCVAFSRCELLEIPSFNFKRVFSEAPSWLRDLTKNMVERFLSTSNLLAENRVLTPLILSEEEYNSKIENEYKKIISQ